MGPPSAVGLCRWGVDMARAGSVCNTGGCPNEAINVGRCADHQPTPYGHSKERRRRSGKSGWTIQREHQAILKRDNGICYVCHRPGATEVDHIVPDFEGGADVAANKAAIHATPCHAEKSKAETVRARAMRPTE
jgi:5-methylcytosine-specific restriction protein A